MDNKKKVKLADMLPIINEKLESGAEVTIPITGTSMLPLLVAGRDTVTLKKADANLKKFDLPLYRRNDGAFVLHRVINKDDNSYTLCGDNQWVFEKGITDNQIIGIVCKITRKGKTFSTESFKYKMYCKIWHSLLFIRKYIVKCRGKFFK
ncbi:MAG: S24/S26 family peptidase [Oscillospiraceae bacterium]